MAIHWYLFDYIATEKYASTKGNRILQQDQGLADIETEKGDRK